MPCSMSAGEIECYETLTNEKEFGLKANNSDLLEEVACQMARLIAKNGLVEEVSPLVKKWIKIHAEKDAKAGRS